MFIKTKTIPVDSTGDIVTSGDITDGSGNVLSEKLDSDEKGANNGVAELDSSGRVPSSQLPSYVDDVLEYSSSSLFPATGESDKIYIDTTTNKTYRWGGSEYVAIGSDLALGETSSTAYRGDRGKTAYDFSQTPYSSDPAMNGVASAGSSTAWAKGDHVHPSDTSKVSTSVVGVANGVASLGSDGKVPSSQLPSTGPSAYTSNPAMNGTASAGSSSNYSRGDHVHPVDTSRASTSSVGTLSNLTTTVKSNLVGAINEVNARALDAGIILKSVRPQIVDKPIVKVASMGYAATAGACIWTDGKDVYYSNGNDQKVLNKSNLTWENMPWGGYAAVDGRDIWTDGENVYHSNEDYTDRQHVLNKNTYTWNNMTWNGMTKFSGKYIWTDGTNIYFSKDNTQKVLDKSTSTWSDTEWQNGSGNALRLYGDQIWTDGENMYYSSYNLHYVFDKTTSKWISKTWNGLTKFYGENIWTDGTNIYYSEGTSESQYVLDKSTSTWVRKSRGGDENFYGKTVWTDGRNIYHTNTWTYLIKELSPNPKPKAK